MSDIDDVISELSRTKIKKPRSTTKLSLVAGDLVFLLLDIGSGAGVWYMTGVLFYGILVIFAGIAPLLYWQKQFTQPMASDDQRGLAKAGIVLSVVSVVLVGLIIGVVRFLSNTAAAEISLAVILVLLAASHGMLSFWYFFISDEFEAEQQEAQVISKAVAKIRQYKTAEMVLDATQKAVGERKRVESKYSPEAVKKALGDDNTPN